MVFTWLAYNGAMSLIGKKGGSRMKKMVKGGALLLAAAAVLLAGAVYFGWQRWKRPRQKK